MWSKFYVIKYAQFATLSHEITRLQSCGLLYNDESSITFWKKNLHLQTLYDVCYVNSYCENNCKIPFDPHAMMMFSGSRHTMYKKLHSTSSWNFNELKPLTICTFHFVISLNCDMIGRHIGSYHRYTNTILIPTWNSNACTYLTIWIDISQLSLPFSHQGNPCGMGFLDFILIIFFASSLYLLTAQWVRNWKKYILIKETD